MQSFCLPVLCLHSWINLAHTQAQGASDSCAGHCCDIYEVQYRMRYDLAGLDVDHVGGKLFALDYCCFACRSDRNTINCTYFSYDYDTFQCDIYDLKGFDVRQLEYEPYDNGTYRTGRTKLDKWVTTTRTQTRSHGWTTATEKPGSTISPDDTATSSALEITRKNSVAGVSEYKAFIIGMSIIFLLVICNIVTAVYLYRRWSVKKVMSNNKTATASESSSGSLRSNMNKSIISFHTSDKFFSHGTRGSGSNESEELVKRVSVSPIHECHTERNLSEKVSPIPNQEFHRENASDSESLILEEAK